MPFDASITTERVNSDFLDGFNRGKSQGANTIHSSRRVKLKF